MSGQHSPTTFVGRTTELEALRAAMVRASAGEAAFVLVSGAAGVGKTRLVEELVRTAEDDGAIVLLGRCVDLGDGELAYAPVASALRSLPALVEEAELAEVLGEGRRELARLVPALGSSDLAVIDDTAMPSKERLFESLLGVLSRLGEQRTVVLVIEDLHWADGSTRDLLRFLMRSAAHERLVLITTCRADDIDRAHPVRPYLIELRRDPRVEFVDLEPFSRRDFDDHVAAVLGRLPSPAELDELYARTEGNAFYTEELLAAADMSELPVSIREAMAMHLEHLPHTAQRVVTVLAAAGRRVDHRLLERAAALPARDLTAGLRGALEARVIIATDDARGYEFRHALLREVAYRDLLPGERQELHGVLARELDADPLLGGDGAASPAEIAYHWDAAGDRERALVAWVRAATDAERVFAHPEALRHLQRALELCELGPPPVDGVDQLELTQRAAEAACAAGDAQVAIALAARSVEMADAPRAARQQALLARRLWDGGRGADALAVSTRALALAPSEQTPERARLLESHARLLLLTGRADEANAPIDEAIAIARSFGAQDIEAAALATRVITKGDRGDAAIAAGREALVAAQRDGDPDTLMRAYINASEALDHGGRVEDAIELARHAVDESRRLGMRRVMGAHLQGEIAGRLVKLGRYDDAEAVIDDGMRAAPEGTAAVSLHHAAAGLAARRGDADAAAVALATAYADDAGSGQSTARGAAALAELALWAGDPERASNIVESALGLVAEGEYVWYSAPLYAMGVWAAGDQALSASARGDGAGACAAHSSAEALGARLEDLLRVADLPEPIAYGAQVRAELTRLADAPEPTAWAHTREQWQALGFPFHAAVCGWREAAALLHSGTDRSSAARLLVDAHGVAEKLGAGPLASAVATLARRARIAIEPVEGDAPERPPAGLTSRELEVLRLIADGRTNREIGVALFISPKTVSVHVSHVLAKLGAANRAEAATIAERLGVTHTST